jgi:thiol-disulfide isomerase/thioredoxin
MNKRKQVIVSIVVLSIIVSGVYASMRTKIPDAMSKDTTTDLAMMKSEDHPAMVSDAMKDKGMMGKDVSMMTAGVYEVYSPEKVLLASTTHNVVLFFRASWCPTCKALDVDIKANLAHIPENLSILDVNYDTYVALKQKYGVTYQHTFVQVDKDGNLIKKWSGSPTLAALVVEVK